MYVGVDDALKTRYPREITVNGVGISDEDAGKLNSVIKEEIKGKG